MNNSVLPLHKQSHSSESSSSKLFRLSFLVTFIFIFHAILLEYMYSDEKLKDMSWALSLIDMTIFSFLAYIQRVHQNSSSDQLFLFSNKAIKSFSASTWIQIFLLSISIMLSQGLSTRALMYTNFTTLVIFKSCKLVPVLVGRLLLLDKMPASSEVFSVSFSVIGLLLFSFAVINETIEFHFTGIMLLLASLVFDGLVPNLQEKFLQPPYSIDKSDLLLYSNILGTISLFVISLIFFPSHFFYSISYILTSPKAIILCCLSGGLVFLGVNVIFHLTKLYDSLLAQIITSARKGVTMVLSIILFPKVFSIFHFFGTVMVFLGVFVNIIYRNPLQSDTTWFSIHKKYVTPLSNIWHSFSSARRYGLTISFGICAFLITVFVVHSITIEHEQDSWREYTEPNWLKKPKVCASLSSTPSRINDIEPTIISLETQSLIPDVIYLNIPNWSIKEDREYPIPDWVKNHPKVKILRSYDYGSSTKLLPAVFEEKDPRTIIVTFDDDRMYHPDTLKSLVKWSIRHPTTAFAHLGWRACFDNQTDCFRWHGRPSHKKYVPEQVDVLSGWQAVLYRKGFFNEEELKNYEPFAPECRVGDDFYISAHLAKQGIPRRLVPKMDRPEWIVSNLDHQEDVGSLHLMPHGLAHYYHTCGDSFKKLYPFLFQGDYRSIYSSLDMELSNMGNINT